MPSPKRTKLPPGIVGVDVGGTFTDFAVIDEGRVRVHKRLSTPDDPARAVLAGLRELGIAKGIAVVHGSTVATNALIERKGSSTALVATRGFEDVIEIGRQNRMDLYNFDTSRPEPLVPVGRRFGVPERVASDGRPLQPLLQKDAVEIARRVNESGAESVAVSLLFSFMYPEHERLISQALNKIGSTTYVCLSSDVLPEFREYERTSTTVVNAYVGPVVHRYTVKLAEEIGGSLRIMQSSGGSVAANGAVARPVDTISGGPAAGVIGAFHLASNSGYTNVICFDMGGTSTDVSLCPGAILQTTEWAVAGQPIRTPATDIYSVGAGGGSLARVDAGGALRVGPDSAGANPGPACYGIGLLPTVTDANLLLGRLAVERPLGDTVLMNRDRASEAITPLGLRMGMTAEDAAAGIVRITNANMERAIRVISVERGHDPRDFTMVAYGGAGPVQACELADGLGIPRVLVPPSPGLLSAQGMTVSDIVRAYSRTIMLPAEGASAGAVESAFRDLAKRGLAELRLMGMARSRIRLQPSLDVRYIGQSHEVNVTHTTGAIESALRRFHEAHAERYGYSHPTWPTEIVNVRMKVVGRLPKPPTHVAEQSGSDSSMAFIDRRPVIFEGSVIDSPAYDRERLECGNRIDGPALVLQYDTTIVMPPNWTGHVDRNMNLIVEARAV